MKKYKKIYILLGFILIVIGGIFIYKYSVDDITKAQIKDNNASKNLKIINENMFSINNPIAEKKLLENNNNFPLETTAYPFGKRGIYGTNITDIDLDDFGIEKNSENLKKKEYLNKKRIYLAQKLQKIFINTIETKELNTYIKDGVLNKEVEINYFEEMKFRRVWYNLSDRIFHKYEGMEFKEETSVYKNLYKGKLFEFLESQNKAMSILINYKNEFISEDKTKFTITYEAIDGKWQMTNYVEYVEACLGYYSQENSPEDEEAVNRMIANRNKLGKKIFNENFNNVKDKDALIINNINEDEINNIQIK